MSCIILIFFTFTVIGYYVFKRTKAGYFLFPNFDYRRSNTLMVLLLIVMVGLSFVVALLPILKAGSILKAIYLVRNDGFYAGFAFMIQIIRFTELLSAGFLADLLVRRKKGQHSGDQYIVVTVLIFLGSLIFGVIMGGKSHVIIPLFFLILSYSYCVSKRPITRLIFPSVLLLLLVIILQFGRVTLVHNATVKNPMQHAYKALNFAIFDMNIVYLATLNKKHHIAAGEDYYYGAVGIVPRSLWRDKPSIINAGGRFKNSLDPYSEGGWPVFGYNQLYSNFGWIGVIAGGMIYGWLLRTIQERYGENRNSPMSFVIGASIALFVLSPDGIKNDIFAQYIFCLLYTSDASDDMQCGNLGGCRTV